jgi:hypothetical protein
MISSTVNRDCRMKVSPVFEASHYNSLIFGEQLKTSVGFAGEERVSKR